MHYLKFFSLAIFVLFFLFNPSILFAESYNEAIANALTNIQNVFGTNTFVPDYPARGNKAMVTIQGAPTLENSTFGLTYKSNYGDGKNYLIVRTLTNSGYYCSSTTGALTSGTGDYTTFGGASSAATWVTTGNEATGFINDNVASADKVVTTMERGLGMSGGGTHTAIVEYGIVANNNNLIRPTNLLDIKHYSTANTDYTYHDTFTAIKPAEMNDAVFSNAQTYLQNWQTSALKNSTFPWTELDYTYYWGQSSTGLNSIQGLSEFIILGSTAVKIIGIYSPQSYYYTKNKNGVFSAATDAEYGNGFASFNVTQDCDTIWAGNAFQVEASTDSDSPNRIVIGSGATISGGQGILVWSPNYTVTNSGTISGATDNKLKDANTSPIRPGLSGTADVALLFLGDTSYGAVAGGKNIVTNSGIISSPGTAIESYAGNTEIINTGTISGDSYGLRFRGGTNSITNTGTIESDDTAIRIEAGTTSINSTGTISGHVTLVSEPTASLDIGDSTLTLSGSGVYSQNSQTTLKTTVNSPIDFGKIAATGAGASVASDSTLYVRVGGYIPDNATFSNVISSTGVNVNVPDTISSGSPIFNFSGANGTGDHLDITATRANSYNSFATNANSNAAGTVLNTLAMSGTPSGDIEDVLGQLDSLESGDAIDDALNSVVPVVDGGQTTVSNNILDKFVGTTILRLQDSKIEEGKGENIAQEINPKNDIWAQFYGDYAHQGKRGLSNGYRAKIWGTVLGIDRLFREGALRLGLAQGFGFSKIRSKDNYGRTSIDSYQTGLYGEYQGKNKPYILDAALTYGYNDYDSSRHVSVGSINRTAQSDYYGHQFSSYLEAGYKIVKKGFEIIPLLALNYTHLYLSGYTEKGADSLNLTVNSQKYDSLQLGLGCRLSKAFETKTSIITPELRFRYFYSIINDKQQTIASFAGGGTSFKTTGYRSAPSSFDLGMRIEFFNKKNITLLADCNTMLKDDYYEAGGSLTFKYSF